MDSDLDTDQSKADCLEYCYQVILGCWVFGGFF